MAVLVEDSRQFEKRLLKVVTVNLPLYTNNYNTKSCISWYGDPQAWERQYPKYGGKIFHA
jgi:hypothetical protein